MGEYRTDMPPAASEWAQIVRLRREEQEAYRDWRAKVEQAKAAKGRYEAIGGRLGDLIDDFSQEADLPLLGAARALPGDPAGDGASAAADAEAGWGTREAIAARLADHGRIGAHEIPPPAPVSDDESWRRVSLREYGLRPGLLDRLNAADLFTVGQLGEYLDRNGPLSQSVPGIGKVAEEAIRGADAAFWVRWRKGEVAVPPEVVGAAIDEISDEDRGLLFRDIDDIEDDDEEGRPTDRGSSC